MLVLSHHCIFPLNPQIRICKKNHGFEYVGSARTPIAYAYHMKVCAVIKVLRGLHGPRIFVWGLKVSYEKPKESEHVNLWIWFSFQCSFYPNCKNSQVSNERAVAEYERNYGTKGLSYPCLYNPHNQKEVIRTRRFNLNHVIHGITWSTAVFIFSVICLSLLIKKHRCKFL